MPVKVLQSRPLADRIGRNSTQTDRYVLAAGALDDAKREFLPRTGWRARFHEHLQHPNSHGDPATPRLCKKLTGTHRVIGS